MDFSLIIDKIWLKSLNDASKGIKLVQAALFMLLPDGSIMPGSNTVIGVDNLNAMEGESVLICTGSKVRDVTIGRDVATKKVVISIIDDFQFDPDLLPLPLLDSNGKC